MKALNNMFVKVLTSQFKSAKIDEKADKLLMTDDSCPLFYLLFILKPIYLSTFVISRKKVLVLCIVSFIVTLVHLQLKFR
jgi:hypothetical protein